MNTLRTIEALYTAQDLSAGDLNHADWNNARAIQITHYWSGEPAPLDRHAEARMLWSDDSLCVRFVCRQTEPLIVSSNPQTETKTMGLWDRDVCEAFIAPGSEPPTRYYEFEGAPTGEWIDLAIQVNQSQRETDWDFDSGMTTSARIDEEQTIIGMRIPWGERVHRPQREERWRVNLFRCVGSGKDRGYLAWLPTFSEQPNFHVPEVFGWLVFGP